MGFRIRIPEPGNAVVRINLRSLERSVTQEFLNLAHVGSAIEQVCGKRVTKDMGAFLPLYAASCELLLHDVVHGDPGYAFSFVS